MKKLIRGIVDFRKRVLPTYQDKFAELAKGQSPDSLFITCSDSRVAPNWFASTDPGDLFVIRNVGNLISPCGTSGFTNGDESEMAAVEFAVHSLGVPDIIVCGHSECGAMHAVMNNCCPENSPHLKSWLRHGQPPLELLRKGGGLDKSLSEMNQLSQLNVLQQRENLKTYPWIKERVDQGKLKIHAWWFEIAKGAIHSFNETSGRFEIIDRYDEDA